MDTAQRSRAWVALYVQIRFFKRTHKAQLHVRRFSQVVSQCQLNTEVGVQLSYDRRQRYAVGRRWAAQFLPEAGADLGNIRIGVHAGGTLRAGYHIPDEFGGGPSQPGWDWGAYIFGGVSGRAVLLDIFLDGNIFSESHHVNKEPLVGEARFGGAITTQHLEISLMHVKRSREFEAQGVADGFTSLTLKF